MNDNRDRDHQILSRLSKIEHRVDSIDQTTAFALRAEEGKHLESVRKVFGTSKRRAQVYLAADGKRSVQEIAVHIGVVRQAVGRELKSLKDEGVLELSDVVDGKDIWNKKALERTLRISRLLQDQFNLRVDGRPAGRAGKRRKRR